MIAVQHAQLFVVEAHERESVVLIEMRMVRKYRIRDARIPVFGAQWLALDQRADHTRSGMLAAG
ncbi:MULTISPECIES: hypothetical protein [Stenotrophomonas]|uniref:hypothetical protein n=1 Tax=Stenotrophomonas TaxID=40323 RepID=UPI0018DF2C04|nr:hypothetical protein [Stenotrophomonas maltophilia]